VTLSSNFGTTFISWELLELAILKLACGLIVRGTDKRNVKLGQRRWGTNERTNEVYLPMNGVNNDWLPVKSEAHQSWPPKNKKKLTN